MHWSTRYLGTPYQLGDADCASLVCNVRSDVFGGHVPNEAEVNRLQSALGRAGQIQDGVSSFGIKTNNPTEGDVVLMMCRARPSHVGVYCEIDGIPYVLHAMQNAGQVVLHKLSDLPKVHLTIEGFYQWKS